jgi:RNA polymerase sigma-70 factor (ECF subfamily)
MVMRRCRTLLRGEEDALDAMQDTFVHLLHNAHRLVDASPTSLLYRMATNVCLNRIRSRKSRPEESHGHLLETMAQWNDPETAYAARNLLSRLFERHRESTGTLAVMHFLDGMTLEEVAAAAGMSVSGVRKRLSGLKTGLAALS